MLNNAKIQNPNEQNMRIFRTMSLPEFPLLVIVARPHFLSLRGAEGNEAISKILNLEYLKFEFV
jgi:hypothetical protein